MWRHVAQNQSSSGSSFRPIQDKCQPFPQPVASLPQSTIGFCGVEWDPAHSWHTSSSNPSDAIMTSTEADGLFFPGAAATTAGLVAILSCAFASPARIVNVSTQRQGGPGPAHWPADSQQRPPSPEGSQSHRVVADGSQHTLAVTSHHAHDKGQGSTPDGASPRNSPDRSSHPTVPGMRSCVCPPLRGAASCCLLLRFRQGQALLVDPLRFAVFSGAHQPQSVAQNQPPTATPICPMAGPDEQNRRPR